MIKANELRVGNILNKEGIIVRIDGRSIMDIEYSDSYAEKYKPIALTPEILVKAGFINMGSMYYQNGINVDSFNGVWMKGNTFIRGVLYLHQLQNLYFALTGEELEVNL